MAEYNKYPPFQRAENGTFSGEYEDEKGIRRHVQGVRSYSPFTREVQDRINKLSRSYREIVGYEALELPEIIQYETPEDVAELIKILRNERSDRFRKFHEEKDANSGF